MENAQLYLVLPIKNMSEIADALKRIAASPKVDDRARRDAKAALATLRAGQVVMLEEHGKLVVQENNYDPQ